MATANTYLELSEVDFSDIRTNLKSYLSTQTQFQDYDFEGSAISTLLDVLAYNTHYNAFYANMLANEMFLDTAQQRDSVVSRAKELNYLPISAKGSSANVTLTFNGVASTVGNFDIAANSTFSTTIDDITYTYVTPQAYTVVNNNNNFVKEITITEGEPLQHRWTVDTSAPVQYILPNHDIDVDSIKVVVQESATDTTKTTFTRATNIVAVSDTSTVYFLHETIDEKHEITFGDGILGKPVKNNNIIIVDYRVCNGTTTNGANTFSVGTVTAGASFSSVDLVLKSKATGGRELESVDDVKFNAPKNYETQNRAIIAEDFSRILLNENSDLSSVTSFGGEEREPAVFGKVYIAVKPLVEQYVTEARKNELKLSINDRTPIAVDPVLIDPEYLYVIPTVTVRFDEKTTTQTTDALVALVKAALVDYNTDNLNKFKKRLRFSRLTRAVDNVDKAIFNTEMTLSLQNRFVPDVNLSQQYILKFKNKLTKSTLSSTQFTFDGYQAFFGDDGLGKVTIFRFDSALEKVIIKDNTGTIDYDTGEVNIKAFQPTAFEGIEIKVDATPVNLDVVPTQETIIMIDSEAATISAVSEV